VFTSTGGEAGGDGGGLLANMGLNRVGTHLKGPATFSWSLSAIVRVGGGQEERAGGGGAQASKWQQS